MFLITSEQIRACRAVLRWTVDDLAEKTGISVSTLKRIEKVNGYPSCRIENIEKIRTTFEKTNAVHLPDSKTVILVTESDKSGNDDIAS